ncbi:MAG: aspartate-ammonia lyase [Candidatus Latescibacter sp.]|nr:aspartate-ammonia lyase [Candidatus Latescibacter sp.]
MNSANNLVGTAGEYFVCAELCRQGYLALLTPKNNPLFDIVVTNRDITRSVSIQVKTRSVHNKQGWKLGADITSGLVPKGLFVALVNLTVDGSPEYYVYEYSTLSRRVSEVYTAYITKPKRDGSMRKEVGFRWFDEISFDEDDHSRRNNWSPIIRALENS